MRRRVRTADGVGWTIRAGLRRPRRGAQPGPNRAVGANSGGFGPLTVVVALVTLAVLTPVLVGSGRGWLLIAAGPLAILAWLLLGRYRVEARREGSAESIHEASVAGRQAARRLVDELAAEIAHSTDDQLGGQARRGESD